MLIKHFKLTFLGLIAASMTLPIAAPANALISTTSEESIATSKQELTLIASNKFRRRRRYRRRRRRYRYPRSFFIRIGRRRYPKYYRYRRYPKYYRSRRRRRYYRSRKYPKYYLYRRY